MGEAEQQWVFRNAEQEAQAGEVRLPSKYLRADLRSGDMVRVCVVVTDGLHAGLAESCWLMVRAKSGLMYEGIVRSNLGFVRFRIGAKVEFGPEHVYEVLQ
jgi:hypothetical protein